MGVLDRTDLFNELIQSNRSNILIEIKIEYKYPFDQSNTLIK